jgi:hypothetical protein
LGRERGNESVLILVTVKKIIAKREIKHVMFERERDKRRTQTEKKHDSRA